MASASRNSVCSFVQSLSREELLTFNPAELYKLIEFGLIQEERVVSPGSSAAEVREAIILWCAGALTEWDILENSPWFNHFHDEKPDVRHFVARCRQRITAARVTASQESPDFISEEVLAELFED
jgi:hypothetical protein